MATQTSVGAEEIVTIDVHKANDLIHSVNYRYLDVRTEEEFFNGHVDVKNPINIAYMFNTPEGRVKNPNFLEQVVAVCSKDDHLVVGCQSGVRSVYATIDLQNNEFKHVYNMGGGYLAWVKNGLPVTKPQLETDIHLPVIVTNPKVEINGLPVASASASASTKLKAENDLPDTLTKPEVANGLPETGTSTEPKIEL